MQLSLARIPLVFSTACRPTSLAGCLAAAGALQLRTEGNGRSASVRGEVQRMQSMRTVCF